MWRARAPWAAIGLAAAGAVVAIASREPLHHSGGGTVTVSRTPGDLIGLLMLAAVAVGAAMLLLAITGGRLRRSRTPEPDVPELEIPWWTKLLAAGFLLLLGGGMVTAALVALRDDRRRGVQPLPPARLGRGHLRAPHPTRAPAPAYVVPGWLGWLVLGLVLVAVLVVGVVALRRRQDDARRGAAQGTSPAQAAVAAASAALATGEDPRAGVIRAYLAMLRTLEARGVARGASEAPREYLDRALVSEATAGTVGAASAAGALTGLFEEARFSVHPITEVARDRAGEALGVLRSGLAEAER